MTSHFFLGSDLLQNFFLCWDRWNGEVMPTLYAALLYSSRVGSDLSRMLLSALSLRHVSKTANAACHPTIGIATVFPLLNDWYTYLDGIQSTVAEWHFLWSRRFTTKPPHLDWLLTYWMQNLFFLFLFSAEQALQYINKKIYSSNYFDCIQKVTTIVFLCD